MQIVRKPILAFFGVVLFAGTGLLLLNSLEYFLAPTDHPFILEKLPISADFIWKHSLLLHIISGTACMFLALPLLVPPRWLPWKIHGQLGRIYAALYLFVVGPTGIHLALYAKGGLWGQLGFATQGLLGIFFTVMGILTIIRGDVKAHRAWMVHSYGMIATAITFRILHYGFFLIEMDYMTNYLASLWLSTFLNIALVQGVLNLLNHNPTKGTHHEPHQKNAGSWSNRSIRPDPHSNPALVG